MWEIVLYCALALLVLFILIVIIRALNFKPLNNTFIDNEVV